MKVYFHDNTPAAPGEKHGERGPTHCGTAAVDYAYQVEQHVLCAAKDLPQVVRIECPELGLEWERKGDIFVEVDPVRTGRPDWITCIQRPHAEDRGKSWCGRRISSEFHLVGLDHAASLQKDRLQPCPKCVEKACEELYSLAPDNCQRCYGQRGGMLGNENRVNGEVLCDYCTSEALG